MNNLGNPYKSYNEFINERNKQYDKVFRIHGNKLNHWLKLSKELDKLREIRINKRGDTQFEEIK